MTIAVHHVFFLLGLIVVVSFLGTVFSKTLRLPIPVMLIAIGILVGQWHGGLDLGALRVIAPYFGALALILILLEAGLEIPLKSFFANFGQALLFGSIAYFAALFAIAFALHGVLDFPLPLSFLVGAVSAGASPAILLPVLKGMGMEEKDRTLLDLECTVTEVLGLVMAIVSAPYLLESLATGADPSVSVIFSSSLQKFGMILVLGLTLPLIVGLTWSRLLSFSEEQRLWPILSVGVTFLLYGVTETLGGKGAISVFIFGLVLGNARSLSRGIYLQSARLFSPSSRVSSFLRRLFSEKSESVKRTSEELSFFVRTFFFVYLGFLFDFSSFSLQVIAVTIVAALVPMFIRFFLARVSGKVGLLDGHMQVPLTFLFPRGLANAVAAFTIVAEGARLPNAQALPQGWENLIISPAFGVILISNLILSVYLVTLKKRDLISGQIV